MYLEASGNNWRYCGMIVILEVINIIEVENNSPFVNY